MCNGITVCIIIIIIISSIIIIIHKCMPTSAFAKFLARFNFYRFSLFISALNYLGLLSVGGYT